MVDTVTFQHYTVTVTNTANGLSFTSLAAGLLRFTPDSAMSAGLVSHFVLPADGSLTVNAGRIFFGPDGSVVLNGRFDVRSGDVTPLCDALT